MPTINATQLATRDFVIGGSSGGLNISTGSIVGLAFIVVIVLLVMGFVSWALFVYGTGHTCCGCCRRRKKAAVDEDPEMNEKGGVRISKTLRKPHNRPESNMSQFTSNGELGMRQEPQAVV
jgi:hypothetical protein